MLLGAITLLKQGLPPRKRQLEAGDSWWDLVPGDEVLATNEYMLNYLTDWLFGTKDFLLRIAFQCQAHSFSSNMPNLTAAKSVYRQSNDWLTCHLLSFLARVPFYLEGAGGGRPLTCAAVLRSAIRLK